jgi:hypothetical protein
MAAVKSNLMATNDIPRVSRRAIAGFAEKMQNKKMPKVVKFLIFIVCCIALLADVAFIIWTMQLKLLIVVPAVLSAAYLSYLAAYWTILK